MTENRKSVGVVLYREPKAGPDKDAQSREYLLLHYAAGHWDFPKGGQDKGETNEHTWRRELKEETGIEKAVLVPGFQDEFTYFFREQGQLIRKTVTWCLAKTTEKTVTLSFEHKDHAWLPFEQAKGQLTHKNAKELLLKVDAFLQK